MRTPSTHFRSLCAVLSTVAFDVASPAIARSPVRRATPRPGARRAAAPMLSAPGSRPSLCLIDGHSLAYRMNFALQKTGMSTDRGEPTHALHGFCTKLLDLENRFPDHRMAVAFDLPGPTFRSSQLKTYKADRPSMPTDLRLQIELIREACGHFGLPSLSAPTYEGDDVLATCTAAATTAQFASVVIVTSDKDMLQLVTPDDAATRVTVWNDRAKLSMDAPAVFAKHGVGPHQMVDFLALMGDASDSVPGVPGVGPKGAAQLLQAHGTLEGVLAAAPGMKKGKRREALLDFAEQARAGRGLIELVKDVPLDADLATGLPMSVMSDELAPFLERWQLGRVASTVRRLRGVQERLARRRGPGQ